MPLHAGAAECHLNSSNTYRDLQGTLVWSGPPLPKSAGAVALPMWTQIFRRPCTAENRFRRVSTFALLPPLTQAILACFQAQASLPAQMEMELDDGVRPPTGANPARAQHQRS